MDVDYRQVRIDFDQPENNQPVLPDLSKFPAASKFLPTGAEIYKVVKYLDLTANFEIVLVKVLHLIFVVRVPLIIVLDINIRDEFVHSWTTAFLFLSITDGLCLHAHSSLGQRFRWILDQSSST